MPVDQSAAPHVLLLLLLLVIINWFVQLDVYMKSWSYAVTYLCSYLDHVQAYIKPLFSGLGVF